MAFPFYKQPDSMDCGPTCLRMIAKHYGKSISLQSLRDKSQIGKDGVNMLGISDAAEAIGFRTAAVKLSLSQLIKEAQLPAIIHWNQEHFVILYKVKRNKLYVADPGSGLLQYTVAEFSSRWVSDQQDDVEQGIVLLLEPSPAFYDHDAVTEDDAPSGSSALAFKNIYRYILPHKKMLLQLLLGLGIASLLQLILPFLAQSVIDVGINTHNIHFVYLVLLAQLALFAGRLAIELVRSWILLHISTRINLSILTDFLIKLMKLPVSFFDSKKTGDIMQRMNDHSRIESFLTGSSLSVMFSALNLVVLSSVLAMFNSSIFMVFIISAILYTIWVIVFLKRRRQIDYKRFDIAAREQSSMIQLVQGMQEIKLNGVEKPMRWNWERLQARLFKLSIKSLFLNQWQQAGAFFINEGKNIFITFLSASAVINGQMTLGTMLAIQYIIGQLNSPIEQMVSFAQNWQNAKISMDRLNEIHNIEDEEPLHRGLLNQLPPSMMRKLTGGKSVQAPSNYEEPTVKHAGNNYADDTAYDGYENLQKNEPALSSIQFNDVSFTYAGAGNEPVLNNINLIIPKGKTTAIVGMSGSGKTTLLKLLLKFYRPQKGEIKLGNTSLENISHKAWRAHCGVVMQESFIFSDTIAKNIAVGQEKIDMDRLQWAASIANVKDFIETLPLGYNTKIGTEGTGVSMGQKQRILIARAVYRDPDFIFFDEATNSLDANNESTILNNLERFFNGRTAVVVAHRLSTVKKADQIVVLNKGVITERGTHQELINLKGEYFQLIKNQLELGD